MLMGLKFVKKPPFILCPDSWDFRSSGCTPTLLNTLEYRLLRGTDLHEELQRRFFKVLY